MSVFLPTSWDSRAGLNDVLWCSEPQYLVGEVVSLQVLLFTDCLVCSAVPRMFSCSSDRSLGGLLGHPHGARCAGEVLRCRGAILASEWSDRLLPCILLQSRLGHCYCGHVASRPSLGRSALCQQLLLSFPKYLWFRYSCNCGCGYTWCSAGDHPWLGGCCLFLELTWLLATGPPAVGLLNQTAEEQRGGGAGNSMKRLYLETSKFQWKLNIVACIIKGWTKSTVLVLMA